MVLEWGHEGCRVGCWENDQRLRGKAGASDEAGDASAALFGAPILGKDQGQGNGKTSGNMSTIL